MPAWNDITEWFTAHVGGMDAVFLVVAVAYAIRGGVRGLSAELAGAIGMVLIFVGGWKLYRPVSDWLLAHTRLSQMESANVLALVFSIIVLAAVLGVIRLLLRRLFEKAFEGTLERLGGVFAGLTKGLVLCAIFVFAVKLSAHAYLNQHVVEKSVFGHFVANRLPLIYWQWHDKIAPPPARGDDQDL
jgi:uncharacterized membrane protein required for colicin V production